MKKKICVISGSRADYGIFYSMLKSLKKSRNFNLQIICTNMHLSKKFGYTYKEILRDGFSISKKIPLIYKNNDINEQAKASSILIKKLPAIFDKLKPNLVVVLGDRFETFASTYVAMIKGVPIAHLHGGELTLGVIDERIRHSITKMSDYHFTSTVSYRNRVIQMGENKKKVFHIGYLDVERIKNSKLDSKSNLEKKIKFNLGKKSILFTYHPTEKKIDKEKKNIKVIFNALKKIKNCNFIFTLPNSDPLSDLITNEIYKFKENNKKKCIIFKSMGQNLFYSAMKNCSLIVGNSSSAIIEAPSLNGNILNLGDRQEGRIKSKSVIDCNINTNSIKKKINNLLKRKKKIINNPYHKKNSCKNFIKILKKIHITKKDQKKYFYDIKI